MSSKTRIPQLPGVPTDASPAVRQFLEAIKQTVEVGEGQRGDALDRKLTERDILEIGLAQVRRGAVMTGGAVGAGGRLEPAEPVVNRTRPPEVNGFTASPAFSRIILSWGPPGYRNHSHVEIRRAAVEDFGEAVTIGGPNFGSMTVDVVGGGAKRFYWAANVSDAGVVGPWVGPFSAETPADPEYMLNQLTGDIIESPLYQTLREEIGVQNLEDQWTVKVGTTTEGGETVVGGIGLSAEDPGDGGAGVIDFGVLADRFWIAAPGVDYSQADKRFPFIVDDGVVFIDEASIREAAITNLQVEDGFLANMEAAKGKLPAARLEQAAITQAYFAGPLTSGVVETHDPITNEEHEVWKFLSTFEPGTSGWKIDADGTVEFNDAVFRGHIEAESGHISDAVTIGGIGDLAFKDSLFYSEVSGTKPPTDADNTGSNTSYDTSRVAGTGASTVRDRANNGNLSYDRVYNSWTRPGQTLIDGNKIFTGDAYVDTLQIKGNAVTIPSATNPSNFSPPTFGPGQEFDENSVANEFAEISFNTTNLSSSRVMIVNLSFARYFTFQYNNSGIESAWDEVTLVEYQGGSAVDPTTEYRPVRTYVRLELRRGTNRVAWRWLTFWRDHSVNIQMHWAPIVLAGYSNYSVRALGSCDKGHEFRAIYMDLDLGLR